MQFAILRPSKSTLSLTAAQEVFPEGMSFLSADSTRGVRLWDTLSAADKWGTLQWWEMEPRIDWVTPHWGSEREDMPLATAAGTDLVLVYSPATRRNFDAALRNLETGREYQSSWFDTRSGAVLGARSFTAEEGRAVPARPSLDDWLLVVERV
ncbi:putative collagen-binding domain-containing protein [Chloroflexota bacterium]